MRTLPLLALVPLVLASACGPATAPTSTPSPSAPVTSAADQEPSSSPSAPGATSASPSPSGDGIRGFDFANTFWTDEVSGKKVTLTDGKGTSGSTTFALGKVKQFGDLDGDGQEDAVVSLDGDEGEDWWQPAYIWLWKNGKATQVTTAVTDDHRCGNTTQSLAIEKGKIQVTRLIRAKEPCADQPKHSVKNTIALERGFPVRTSPVRAATSRCLSPMTPAAPAREVVEGRVFLAPDLKAPFRTDTAALGKVSLGGDDNGPKITDSFVQVLFHATGDSTTWYCVYFPGE